MIITRAIYRPKKAHLLFSIFSKKNEQGRQLTVSRKAGRLWKILLR